MQQLSVGKEDVGSQYTGRIIAKPSHEESGALAGHNDHSNQHPHIQREDEL